jgi:hypothetical protein
MRFLGQLEHGMYEDDLDDVDPEILRRHYGVNTNGSSHSASDASSSEESVTSSSASDEAMSSPSVEDVDWQHPPSSPAADANGVAHQIEADISTNLHHEPVSVPKHNNPFQTQQYSDAFMELLEMFVQGEGEVPEGYGAQADEWGVDGYPSVETITSGRRGIKKLRVSTPVHIWLPRAELWAKALHALHLSLDEELKSLRSHV